MPLTLTRVQWERGIARAGMPGPASWSAHLVALADALGHHAAAGREGAAAAAETVRAKFAAWDTGDHPGEHHRLKSTVEYAQLRRELSAADAGAPVAPRRVMLLVAWNCRHDDAWHLLPHAARTRKLEKVLDLAQKQFDGIPAERRAEGPVKIVLVAPEYQYTAPANSRAPMAEAMKVEVESSLRAVSQMHPSVLLIAGSSHYFKDEHRPSGAAKFKVDPSTGLRSLRKPNATRRDRAERKMRAAWDMHNATGKWFLNEHTAVARDPLTGQVIVSVPSMRDVADVLFDPGSKPRFVRNVAYMFLAGRRIAKYDKQTDYSEALNNSANEMMFIPGTENECPVVGGRRYGLEICLDHDTGVLKRRNLADLQFHVVMSDSVTTNTGQMAMAPGGYFLHASTNPSEACCYVRSNDGAGIMKLVPQSVTNGRGRIDFYGVLEPESR
jgi:hypothetical protein